MVGVTVGIAIGLWVAAPSTAERVLVMTSIAFDTTMTASTFESVGALTTTVPVS